ncbi:MAG: CoA pyrophosphatase [Gammaproteobacteria bacterium]|nr:CoA pyrophosphatase [Gammaproteobacteria bacterium]
MDNLDSINNDKEAQRFEYIRTRLDSASPPLPAFDANHRIAAVAIVIRSIGESTDILFIKRATVEGDPWSGQMAFPGGHMDPGDASPQMAAIRETEEETGVHLSMDLYLGRLSHQSPANRPRRQPMVVVPFVFGLRYDPKITINHEVEEVVWGNMSEMMNGSLLASETFEFGRSSSEFEGYLLGDGKFVWGLTYRTLQTLFRTVDALFEER